MPRTKIATAPLPSLCVSLPVTPPQAIYASGHTARAAQDLVVLKKQFLGLYCDNEREIARLEEEILRWQSRAERATSSFSDLPRHAGEDRIQSAVDEICELRAMLYDRLTDAAQLRRAIADAVAAVEDKRLRLLLEFRYIDGLTWERVAAALNCDYRWTLRLHERAIALLPEPKEMPELLF